MMNPGEIAKNPESEEELVKIGLSHILQLHLKNNGKNVDDLENSK
jgi:hypothetical protein